MVLHILHLLKGQANMGSDKIERDSFRAVKAETNEQYLNIVNHKNEQIHAENFRNGEIVAIGGHVDIPTKNAKLASPPKSLRMRIFQEKINRDNSNERG
jgi:hypothetical protein